MNQVIQKRSFKRFAFWLIIIVVAGLIGIRAAQVINSNRQSAIPSGQRSGGFSQRPGAAEFNAISVRVEPARNGSVEEIIVLPGTLEPQYQVEVFPRRAGRLAALEVQVGEWVTPGDILATVEHEALLLEVQQSAANLDASRASLRRVEGQLEKVRRDYDRGALLYEQGAATQQELQNMRNQLEEAEIQLVIAQAQFEQAQVSHESVQLQLRQVHIDAPVAGVVIRSPVVVGSQVNTSASVATIAALNPVEVVFHVPEAQIGRVVPGQSVVVHVDAFPGEQFAGEVTHLGAEVDSRTRTLPVRAQVPNIDLRLRPGMYARVGLVVGREENVLTVPREALMTRPAGFYVFRVEDGRAYIRTVEVGVQGGARVEIVGGIQEGDVIVTVGQQGLSDGEAVRPVEADDQPAAGQDQAQATNPGRRASGREGDAR